MTHLDPKLSFVTQFDVYLLWKHCCDIYQNKVLFARWSHNLKRHANIDIVETRAKQWHQILLSPWECGICYCALLLLELVHFLNITEIIRKYDRREFIRLQYLCWKLKTFTTFVKIFIFLVEFGWFTPSLYFGTSRAMQFVIMILIACC